MEKILNDFVNFFSILPPEIEQHIAAYLDAPALGFFAQSNKQRLKTALPLLRQYQAQIPLCLVTKGDSTYFTQAHQLFGCGDNQHSQLGLGDNEPRATFTAVPWPEDRGRIQQLIVGEFHTIVLTEDNRLWGCGANDNGQLGLGDDEDRATFTAIPWPAERGCIQQVIAGSYHTIVLTENNKLWVCGYNCEGQLGLGDNEDRATFTAVPWPEERGQIQQIIVGGRYTVVLTQDNRLWLCGDNGSGQLGLGDKKYRFTFTAVPWPIERGRIRQVITGLYHTIVLTQDNRLWACGYNNYGQLGLDDVEDRLNFAIPWLEEQGRIQRVSASGFHTVVLTEDNQLWVCGYNAFGQLGLGDNELRATFTKVEWPAEQGQIQQVIAGQYHTLVLTQDNRLWMCGYNKYGQLGLGDNEHRSTYTSVKALPEAMQQVFMLNNHLNRLIKVGTALTLTPGKESETSHRQCQVDEPDDQPSRIKIKL